MHATLRHATIVSMCVCVCVCVCVQERERENQKEFPNVMFAILNCIGDASRDHGSPSPPPWHLAPSKGGGWGNGIKGMVQNRPTIYRVINWKKGGFMGCCMAEGGSAPRQPSI